MPDRLFEDEVVTISRVPKVSALETDFPGSMLSEVGLKESWRKEIHRPATSTHKWWAKRLGSIFRGIITSAVAEPGRASTLYASRADLHGLIVLDPFGGSGTTAVEALKLGARVISLDINPVATLVQRQAVQPWRMSELRTKYAEVEIACRAEIDRVHTCEDGRVALYYFWVAAADCPNCAEVVYLFDSPVYSKNAYPSRVPKAQLVCPKCLDLQESRYDFETATCANGHVISRRGNVARSEMTCTCGHTSKILKALGGRVPRFEMYSKMVVDSGGHKSYESITDWDRRLYAECEKLVADLPSSVVSPVGDLASGNNTNQAMNWNFRTWADFFNARQRYSLSLLATAIRDLPGHESEREALCALFSGALEFNNLFASFKGEGTGAVRHMFSHHVLKPERTPLEAHPWGTPQSSGSFSTLLKSRIERASEYKNDPHDLVLEGGSVVRRWGLAHALRTEIVDNWQAFEKSTDVAYIATANSAITDIPDGVVDLVVSDPPYMDNVHYAELADFFHAWLRSVKPYPEYPDSITTRREGEVQHADPVEFGRAIASVWTECARVLKPEGLLAFTFHQARITGWAEVVLALRDAGLVITAIQPVKGEMSTSIVKSGAREPSNLDSVVVCRKVSWRGDSVHESLNSAYASAVQNLSRLIRGGVDVGAGDIRSVVRGTLLAYVASAYADLPEHFSEVDRHANLAIAELLKD